MNWRVLLGVLCALGVTTGAPSGTREIDLGKDANSPGRQDIIAAAHWATEQICNSRNSPVHLKFLELTNAKEEVLESGEGKQYELTIKLVESDCSKREMEVSACLQSPQQDHGILICTATVWSRPWKMEPENLKFISSQSHPSPFNCQDMA